MKTKKNRNKEFPVVASGDNEYLEKKATEQEKKTGNY